MNLGGLCCSGALIKIYTRAFVGRSYPKDTKSQWSKSQFYSSASLEHHFSCVGEGPHCCGSCCSFLYFLTGMQKAQNFLQHP